MMVVEKLQLKKLRYDRPSLAVELQVVDLAFFRNAKADYDHADALGADWTGNVLDILEDESIIAEDRIWAASRKGAMDDRLQRLCAIATILNTSTNQGSVLDLMEDKRSIKAVTVAENFVFGQASDKELVAAEEAAWDAGGAVRATARVARVAGVAGDAGGAVRAAARGAARAAARVAGEAAWDSARVAVRAAAWDAAWEAAWDAAWEAMPAIWAATIRENTKTPTV